MSYTHSEKLVIHNEYTYIIHITLYSDSFLNVPSTYYVHVAVRLVGII